MILNGIPKSGNHALKKACALLGVDLRVNHIPCAEKVSGQYLMIIRHPKNMACSMLQENSGQVTPVGLRYGLPYCYPDGLKKISDDYLDWLTDADTTVVRYEDLTQSDQAMRDLAVLLGVPYVEGAWEKLPGETATWSRHPSDWSRIWSDQTQAWWEANHGPEMEVVYGY